MMASFPVFGVDGSDSLFLTRDDGRIVAVNGFLMFASGRFQRLPILWSGKYSPRFRC